MYRQTSFGLKLFAVVLLLVSPAILRADGFTENFDELPDALNATNVGIFTVISGTVDVLGPSLFGSTCRAPESGSCVDLDGSSNETPGVISTGPLTLDGTYMLSFDLIGSQVAPVTAATVTLGSYDQTFILPINDTTDGIVSVPITFASPTVTALVFTSDTPGDFGSILDNVSLTPVSTPEPATLSLMAIGLGGLLFRRRRPAVDVDSKS
jgi:hypothetical protein